MLRKPSLILALSLLLVSPVQAAYSALHVFGDSLSDNGNAYALSGGAWPVSPPYAERFSDGPTAAEYLSDQLGVDLAPSVAGGTNYAVGGAMTGVFNYNYLVGSPFALPDTLEYTGMLSQAANFASGSPIFDPARALFMLWAAPNDFFFALSTGADLASAAATAVTNLISTVGLLASIGATDFLIPNMPNLAQTPFGLSLDDTRRAGLDTLSRGFNAALAQAIDSTRAGLVRGIPGGLDLFEFDTAGFLAGVIANPADYGFTNVATTCVGLRSGCEGYLFFDAVHPTTAAHQLLASRFYAEVPEPTPPALLLIAAIALMMSRGRPAG
jgi:phospholipase/lecithinase/hemolysin